MAKWSLKVKVKSEKLENLRIGKKNKKPCLLYKWKLFTFLNCYWFSIIIYYSFRHCCWCGQRWRLEFCVSKINRAFVFCFILIVLCPITLYIFTCISVFCIQNVICIPCTVYIHFYIKDFEFERPLFHLWSMCNHIIVNNKLHQPYFNTRAYIADIGKILH